MENDNGTTGCGRREDALAPPAAVLDYCATPPTTASIVPPVVAGVSAFGRGIRVIAGRMRATRAMTPMIVYPVVYALFVPISEAMIGGPISPPRLQPMIINP